MEAERAELPAFRQPRSQVLTTARSVISSTWTLGTLVFLLTWGGGLAAPEAPGIDYSLHSGLNMAAVGGLDHGSDLIFTYGPLGFLKSYVVFYEWPARLATVYGIGLHLALSISLVWAIRRNFGAALAVALAVLVAVLARGNQEAVEVRPDAAVVILALIWCVAMLSRGSPDWVRRVVVYGGGPFAALEILAKLNTGLVVLALVVITLLAIDEGRRRNLAILSATFTGTLVLLWFATGQGFDDVGGLIGGWLDVIAGYSSGARLDWNEHQYDYVLGPLLIAAAGAIAWFATRGLERRRRGAILAIVALTAFTAGKGGFISHDIYHMATFYATMLGVCLVFPLPPDTRLRAGVLVASAGAVAATFTTAFPGYPMTNPVANVRDGAKTIATMLDTSRLEQEIADNRAALVASYDVDPASLELLDGRTVHIEPSEVASAWAYELDWRPLPVFQPYVAWTEDLDRRNADAVASAEGPERILRQDLNALGRYPAFESPAAMIAILCNFEALRTTPDWQVLGRVADRCGEPEPIGTLEGTFGTPFEVPPAPPGSVVFARVDGVGPSGLELLRTLAVRSQGRQVVFEGDPRLYTFIAATAGDGLLLRAPPGIDFPAPFALAPTGEEVTCLLNGGAADRKITIDFYSMPVAP